MSKQGMKVQIFIRKVLLLSKEMGFSISHEDGHGAFMIEEWSQRNEKWFQEAIDATAGCKHD